MENETEVRKCLGDDNVDKLFKWMQDGKISGQNLENIALELGVHGKFKQRRERRIPVDLHELRRVLDDWWERSPGCSWEILKRIFSKTTIALSHLFRLEPELKEPGNKVWENLYDIVKTTHIRCMGCEAEVGDKSAIFSMFADPPPIRSFTNPHGYVHEVITLTKARNIKLASGEQKDDNFVKCIALYFSWSYNPGDLV